MDTEDLEVLLETVRHGSISKAARILRMSQPTVSRRIMRLERDLGVTLIDRQLSTISPTREGLATVRFAERVASETRRLKAELDPDGMLAGELNIASSTAPAERLVPQLLARFVERQQSVTTHLHVMDSQMVETCVVERHCDLGFTGTPPHPGLLRAVPVAEDELVLVVPAGHDLARRDEVEVEDLLSLPFVERQKGSGTRTLVEETLQMAGLAFGCRRIVAEVSSPHSLLSSVRSGQGVGFASEVFVPAVGVKGLRLKGVRLVRALYLVYLDTAVTPVAEAFIRDAAALFQPPGVAAPSFPLQEQAPLVSEVTDGATPLR